MSRLFKMAVGVVTVALGGGGLSPPASHAQTVSGVASQRAFLDQYCVRCHSDSQHQRGAWCRCPLQGFDLDVEEVGARAELWEKVVRKVRGGMMPPAGARRPDNTHAHRLDHLAGDGAGPHGGRPTASGTPDDGPSPQPGRV